MMKSFRTELHCAPSESKIQLRNAFLTIGSCFSHAIGDRLLNFKFKTSVNPFGVIYNPVSIHHVLLLALRNSGIDRASIVARDDVYLSFDFHSDLSSLTEDGLLTMINSQLKKTQAALKNVSWILITYGTTVVYELRDSGKLVANCHKMRADLFRKRQLSLDEMNASFSTLYQELKKLNNNVKIMLTVSPVRHIKDSFETNSVSKAMLRVFCDHAIMTFPDVHYFPAFELMIDDLRDYRFYKSDMLHPTEEAEDYIWNKFVECYFGDEARAFAREWESIRMALNHRPLHRQSTTHQRFLEATLKRIENLSSKADVSEEIELIKQQMMQ